MVTKRDVVLFFVAVTVFGFTVGGLLGILMVIFSVGLMFVFGGAAAGKPFENIVWLFAVVVALINLGEEDAADVMDVEGDRLAGSRSLALSDSIFVI